MNIIYRNWGVIVFAISIIAIFIALIAEYFYNLLPCKMCLYQRYPYYSIIIIYPIFLFLKKGKKIDYEGATNVEFNLNGDAFGTFLEKEVSRGKFRTRQQR